MTSQKKIFLVILSVIIMLSFFNVNGNEFKTDNYVNLKTSAGAETVFYNKSPSNTGVIMIDGSFDNTDNMKINDDSNSEFTSTPAVAIPDEFTDSITITAGVYVSGSVSDTWVDNAVAHVVSGTYVTSVQLNFDPALAGRNFYVSGHFTTTGMSGSLLMNGVGWKTAQTIDFDNEVYNGLNTIVYTAGSMGALQGKVFYFKLVEVGDPTTAIINYTMSVNFSEIQSQELLGVNVSSFHYTNVSTTITSNIFNYTSSSYVQMFSTSNTVETENYFTENVNVANFLNDTGFVRLQFKGSNTDYTFKVLMDYIVITFNYTTLGDPPTWDNLTVIDPLEFGLNATIEINVYSDNTVSFVYLEFDNVNHTMHQEIANFTWYFNNWFINNTGVKPFTIYMLDNYNLTSNVSGSITVVSSPILFMSIILMGILMVLMIYFYSKLRVFLIVLTVFIFSLIFGVNALFITLFPFTPYLQLFFITFQSAIFFKTSLDLNKKKWWK